MLLLGGLLLLASASAEGDGIRVQSTAVPLSARQPTLEKVGPLVYRGGVVLASDDKRFGGLSGLHVSADGSRLLAVSDEGSWLEARIEYDQRGFLSGLSEAEIRPLMSQDGSPLKDKTWQDAEALAALPDGSMLVGFERQHRLLRYRGPKPFGAAAEVFLPPPGIEKAPPNEGLESLAALPDGGLFALTEDMSGRDGLLQGFLWREGRWWKLSYRPIGAPRPADAAALPNGDVLVLERSFSALQGLLLRLRRIASDMLKPGATLDPPVVVELKPPLTVDNLEGIAVRRNEKGETLVYLVSDDNFSRLQRTLLLMFALDASPEGASPGGRR